MYLARIDWTADSTIFLAVALALCAIFVVLLSRISPKRANRRRIEKRPGAPRDGGLID